MSKCTVRDDLPINLRNLQNNNYYPKTFRMNLQMVSLRIPFQPQPNTHRLIITPEVTEST